MIVDIKCIWDVAVAVVLDYNVETVTVDKMVFVGVEVMHAAA